MDSASPVAFGIAGRTSFMAGTKFTFATRTNKAENTASNGFSLDGLRGYRDVHYRSYGEGPAA